MNRERAGSDSELLRGKQRHTDYGTNSGGVDHPEIDRTNYSPGGAQSFSPRSVSSPQQQARFSPEFRTYQFRPVEYLYQAAGGAPGKRKKDSTDSDDESPSVSSTARTTPGSRSSPYTRYSTDDDESYLEKTTPEEYPSGEYLSPTTESAEPIPPAEPPKPSKPKICPAGAGKGGGKKSGPRDSLMTISSECPCTLDAVLNNSIGPWGAWQMRISILASLLKFPIAWFQLGIVFLAPATEFWCARPPPGTVPNVDTMSPREWKTMVGCNGTDHHKACLLHGSCYMHDPRAPLTNPPVPCLWGYEFDTCIYHSTIITEWEMVCTRAKMIDLSQAVLMFGILLGTVILGITSDRFGRKPVLVTCLFIQTIAAVCSALAPSYVLFLVTRFIMAFANAGTMVCSFVMCMEVVGGKWRTIVPVLYQIPFGIGNTVMALIAYFIRDWRYFQLTIGLLSGVFWVYWRYMPESPRWLLATGRKEKAVKLLENIARENGKTEDEIKNALRYIPQLIPLCSDNKPLSIKCLFNTHVILLKTSILCLHWFCAGVSFYGFSQYMGQITSHLYAMVAIGGLISLPGTIICCFIIQKFGRRETIAGAHIFTAACYIGILVIPQGAHFADWPRVVFAALGVIGLAISTPALYLFSGELFPTVLRNAGIGVVMMCSRIGSMVAPFVTSLSTVTYWLPLFILSICVFIEALLVIPLPETKDAALPDTVAEAEAFTKKSVRARNLKYKPSKSIKK